MNLNLTAEETREIETVVKKLTITKEEYFFNSSREKRSYKRSAARQL